MMTKTKMDRSSRFPFSPPKQAPLAVGASRDPHASCNVCSQEVVLRETDNPAVPVPERSKDTGLQSSEEGSPKTRGPRGTG